jgi:hypothetical protein
MEMKRTEEVDDKPLHSIIGGDVTPCTSLTPSTPRSISPFALLSRADSSTSHHHDPLDADDNDLSMLTVSQLVAMEIELLFQYRYWVIIGTVRSVA